MMQQKWSGMVGFGLLQPTTQVIRYGQVWLALVHYNLQLKMIGFDWLWSATTCK